ncbi:MULTISPECIES: DNA-protecting protein DprA [Halocynthiibacter]|uniref:DNA-protecting protein DprA n=1 Tax=Halocynthiibacter halioticoli TaxID=2986804 RepID=A0AAE3LTC1_9RHOB|nr:MULTISPECIES: DNA-protecting protein DprA [Halocynthiibacter]MCV6824876.1 DNA-protecting protein DprA [Halocynthiibacter halioticoli]MCW4057877.1 DNA-protecting protein DprA [Halocynthiibacter sp. SDUM655004]
MNQVELSRCFLALLELKGVGPGAIKKNYSRIQACRSADEVFDTMSSAIGEVDASSWKAALFKAEQHLARSVDVGIEAVALGTSRYPASLMELGTPPAVLFCRGNLSLLDTPMLGVIGTRKANPFGETVAGRVGRHFSGKDVHLCNGLADGIDICSVTHDGAFLPGVIGVMACGLDILERNLTSKKIAERARKLLEAGGVLVSEFVPGAVEDQNSVIASCRLQAGLSQVLLLVQSSSDGGSRFTAGHFAKLPRKLAFIVPPEAQSSDAAFGANLLLLKGKEGLAEFVGLKTLKTLKADLLPMRSKNDYDGVMHSLGSAPTTFL